MSIICIFISLLYIVINLLDLRKKEIRKKLFINILFILCISSFFWFPFLETSVSTRYEVYEPGKMATSESVQNNGITLKQLLITKKGDFVFEFGLPMLIMFCFTIAAFRRIAPEMKSNYIFFLVLGVLSTFMSTKYFPWKFLGNTIAFIQFPWRMLEISGFCLSIICAINLAIVIKNFKLFDAIVLGTIVVIYVISLKGFIPLTEEKIKNPKDFDYGYVTGRNTDCLIGMRKNEYLPKKAYDNYFYLATRENDVLVLEGEAQISQVKKDGNKASCEIKVLKDKTLIELPYIYYPGFTVKIDGSKIKSFESDNGFLAIQLNEIDESDLVVEYTGTNIMKFSKCFSIISLGIFIGYIIIPKFRKKSKNEQ